MTFLLTWFHFPFPGNWPTQFQLQSIFFVFLFRNREPFPVAKNVPIDRLLAMISRLLALNSKSLSKTARANFGTRFSKASCIVRPRNLEMSSFMNRTIDLGVHHPWPSVIRLGCAEIAGGRLQESAIDESDNCYEPFRSSAPVDFHSTWSTSSRSWETLRVKITSNWTNRILKLIYWMCCCPLEYMQEITQPSL